MMSFWGNRSLMCISVELWQKTSTHILFVETFSKPIVNESCANVAENSNAGLNIITKMMRNGVEKSEALSVAQVSFIYLHLIFIKMSVMCDLMLVDFRLTVDTPLTFSWITVAPFIKHGLTLVLGWISNYIHYNVWVKILLIHSQISTVLPWKFRNG